MDAAIRDVLTNSQKRIWCDLDAAKITGLTNNDDVSVWEDSSGNGRDLFNSGENNETSPVYQPDAINGRPAVFFRGVSTDLGTRDCLTSGLNPSGDASSAEQQRTVIPAYQGAKWAMFMVVRPNVDPVGTTVKNRCVWSMDLSADGSGTFTPSSEDIQLWVNRSQDGITTAWDATIPVPASCVVADGPHLVAGVTPNGL